MSETETNALRKWRRAEGLNLDEACEFFALKGYPVSSAKLSRMERDQDIPLKDLSKIQEITGIPAKEMMPADLARLVGAA